MKLRLTSMFVCILCGIQAVHAQTLVTPLENYISTAFPFLLVTPDAGISGMGEAGTAVLNPGNIFTNASGNAFMDGTSGLALDYKRAGSNLVCINGYGTSDKRNHWSGGLRYSSLGGTSVSTPTGSVMQTASNFEMALDAGYVRKLTDKFSTGLSVKYIYSTLSRGTIINGIEIKPVDALAADLSCFYRTPLELGSRQSMLNLGLNLSNLGGKVSYGYPGYELFVPAQFSAGISLESPTSENSSITFALDLNKLMVPTMSLSDVSGIGAMLGSFNDAPGGLQEELHEITIAAGMRYNFEQRVFFRSGYFYEHPTKGGRTYFSLGAGIAFQDAQLDVAYRFYNNSITIVADNALSVTLSVQLGK